MHEMRNGKILNKKFFQFLLPTVLSSMAMSLNEFVDGILVANLIDSDTMTLVNMASPIMFVFAVMFMLLGIGGSTVYSRYLGKYENRKADTVFTAIMLLAGLLSFIILLCGIFFAEPLSYFLCKEEALLPVFSSYVRALIISGVVIVPVQVIVSFLPALGRPGTGTFINIAANVLNLIMDYVFIKVFSMGLLGAACATLSGYVTGLFIIIVLCAAKKMRLPFTRISFRELSSLSKPLSVGVSPATNQVGYCIKVAFSNALAFSFAGLAGAKVFSVCIQTVSMVSVFISGLLDALVPIVSSLYGQRDFTGIRIIMKTAIKLQFLVNLIFFLFFEIWPQAILMIYNVQGDAAAFAAAGIRIFSVMFLFRGFTVLYLYYFPIIGRKTYAFIISLVDGFLGLIPAALILTRINGINGLWQAYAVLSVLLLAAVLIINFIISVRSGGKYSRLLLLEHEDENIPVYECSVKTSDNAISNIAESIQEFCLKERVDKKKAILTAVSVEEMTVYTAEQNTYSRIEDLDIILKIYPDHILIDFSSVGRPFDISSAASTEEYSNMAVLKKTASEIEYNYMIGMNKTRIKVRK